MAITTTNIIPGVTALDVGDLRCPCNKTMPPCGIEVLGETIRLHCCCWRVVAEIELASTKAGAS